jgi:hypothetical protein
MALFMNRFSQKDVMKRQPGGRGFYTPFSLREKGRG